MKKIVCINNENCICDMDIIGPSYHDLIIEETLADLTIGKTYDIIDEDDDEYLIIDDSDDEYWYLKDFFKPLLEIRNEKIDKLLE